MPRPSSDHQDRTRWVLPGAIRALVILGILLAIPFFVAKYIADMTGDRR